MVRGRKTNDPRLSSGLLVSGHLDDWAELAVDHVDGTLDADTKAAVQAHLDGCPECTRRLAAQQSALALLHQVPPADAPPGLEAQVFEKVFRTTESVRAARRAARKTERRRRALLSPAGPWLPATAAAATVLALALALTLTRDTVGLDETATTVAAALSTGAGSVQTLRDAEAAFSSTTSTAVLGSGQATSDSTEVASSLKAANAAPEAAPLRPTGTYLQDRDAMVNGLSSATATAYFFYDTTDGSSVTAAQADTIAAQLTAVTGLCLIDQDLSSGARAFAAYVPRDDAAAVVDLLRSTCDSLNLSVCLSLQPGSEVTSWADAMLPDRSSLAELSASPSPPPETSGWRYTTSTASPTAVGSALTTKATTLAESGTHVLVVIFMAVEE
jgi:anti-sigma factor RsiW